MNPAVLAKEAIARALEGAPPTELPWEAEVEGLFLVIRDAHGDLRASLGTSRAQEPGGRLLARLAVAAIDGDPRFPPLGRADLGRIRIWALGAPRLLLRPEDLNPNEAVRVARPPFEGCFLPENYVGTTWDAHAFLRQACRRVGLDALSFEREGTRVEAFRTELYETGA